MSDKLPSSITVKINKQKKEIFMSFGRLNRCTFLVGDVENVPMIHLNSQMRDAILGELLGEKGNPMEITDDVDISLEDIQRLLDFASAHVLDFTLGALERATALQNKAQPRVAKVQERLATSTATNNGQEN